jgi:hypothetical protein
MTDLRLAHLRRLGVGAEGAVTPEYVVGTVAATSFAIVLAKFLASPLMHNALFDFLRRALGMG